MKKINTSPITTGSAMPFKSGSLEHLQSAYQEPLIDIVQTLQAKNDVEAFPNYSTPIIMYGCRWTGLGVSQGVVAYGTELYRAQAVNITLGVGQVVVGTITTTYFTGTNADPVTFSDSTNNNVHEIREIVWSAGTSGTPGTFDFDDCIMFNEWTTIPYSASYMGAQAGNWTLPGGASDWEVKYKQQGRTIFINFYVNNSTVSASTTYLLLNLPFNANFKFDCYNICFYNSTNNTPTSGACEVKATINTSELRFRPVTLNAWATDTANTTIYGQIIAELDKF
jgi:hypothetical protein